MTTSKELNEALKKNVRCVGEEEYYPFKELAREECDIDLGPELGVLKWVDADRDTDEPGDYLILWEHNDLLYAVYGTYDSWNGVDIYDYDLYPVQEVEKKVVVYRTRSEES